MQPFSIAASIRSAWSTFNARRGVCVGAGALILAVTLLINWQSSALHMGGTPGQYAAFGVVALVISTFLSMGEVQFALRAHDAPHSVRIADLWAPNRFWSYLGAAILSCLFVLVGFVLLIVPGIVFALMVMFASYAVIDEGRGPVDALKASARLTRGHRWKLLGFLFVVVAINLIGVCLVFIGLIVTIPLTLIATAHVYRTLQAQNL